MVENDFVQTPKYVTEALLEREKFEGSILEPCCGAGAISTVLQSKGYQVISSDKNNYGFGFQRDLFTIAEPAENIITNPPFTKQSKVKCHLLSITSKKLALLWYVKSLGFEVETKTSRNLKTVYVFPEKIAWQEIKINWLFAWYVWEKGYEGSVSIHWLERGLTKRAPDLWDSAPLPLLSTPEADTPAGHLSTPPTSG
jgi:methylase of polypeptide subunit release factors